MKPLLVLSYFSMNWFNEGFKERRVFLDILEAFDKVKHVLIQPAATWWVKCYVSLTSILGITSI